MPVEFLSRVQMGAASLTVKFMGMCHGEILLFECATRSLHKSISRGLNRRSPRVVEAAPSRSSERRRLSHTLRKAALHEHNHLLEPVRKVRWGIDEAKAERLINRMRAAHRDVTVENHSLIPNGARLLDRKSDELLAKSPASESRTNIQALQLADAFVVRLDSNAASDACALSCQEQPARGRHVHAWQLRQLFAMTAEGGRVVGVAFHRQRPRHVLGQDFARAIDVSLGFNLGDD